MQEQFLKMYIIVRDDLSNYQKSIEGAHALAAFAIENQILFQRWLNKEIVYLETDEEVMQAVKIKLSTKENIKFVTFQNSKMKHQTTAMAFVANEFNHKEVKPLNSYDW